MIENTIPSEYSIIKFLGRGGFAETYLCQNKSGQKCVVKYLSLPEEDKKYIELAGLEAKVLQNLNHKKIPKFIDFQIVKNGKNIDMFLVQEYVEARNLKQIVESGKHFNEDEVKNIALQVLKILEYLHGFLPQIIHRDIKPSNILLTEDNKIYLIDFGAVKEKLTYLKISESGISTIIGTQGYMPLEQFEGRAIPASDIYSLGLTLVYLLSHLEPLQLPKDGLNFQFRDKVNISEKFYKIIEKMINPDWKHRYRIVIQVKGDILSLNKKEKKSLIKKKNQENDFREMIKTKLSVDETVLWYNKPELYTQLRESYLKVPVIISTIIIILFLTICVFYFKYFILTETLHNALAILTGTLFMITLYGSLLLLSIKSSMGLSAKDVYIEISDNFKTIFYITNKRIISSQLPDNKNFRYFTCYDLKDLLLEKKEYKDGSGTLIFYSLKEGKGEGITVMKDIKFQINGIKNVRKIEKMIINLFYND